MQTNMKLKTLIYLSNVIVNSLSIQDTQLVP
jgi:hypothetical protein